MVPSWVSCSAGSIRAASARSSSTKGRRRGWSCLLNGPQLRRPRRPIGLSQRRGSRFHSTGGQPVLAAGWSAVAWEALQAELYVEFHAAGFDDLGEVHRPVLRYPLIDGMRPTELAAHLKLSKQATNDLIRDLENLGYPRPHGVGGCFIIRCSPSPSGRPR